MRIVLTGGGTGGHVLPFEPIVEALRSTYAKSKEKLPAFLDPEELDICFMGVSNSEIDKLFRTYDIAVWHIPSGKMRRYASALNIVDILYKLPLGIVIALWRMWNIMPDIVVSKGGYGSIPSVIAAVVYRIPILLHESDVIPGSSNRALMKFASAITIGFAVSKEYLAPFATKLFVTGTPVRSIVPNTNKQAAKHVFGFPEQETMLLVMGGSQGAKQINESLLAILPSIIEKMSVLHIAGPSQHEAVAKVAAEILELSPHAAWYKCVPYLDNKMASALAAADVVVARAGASSLAEIARLRLPSLIIPLNESAHDHQRKNALAFEAAGAILVLDPVNVSPHILKESIFRLVLDTELQKTLAKNLERLDFPNAAQDIANLVFRLAAGFRPV